MRSVAALAADAPPSSVIAEARADYPPILLSIADFYGTLAAARDLSPRGAPVTIADWRLLAPAGWSRSVARRVRCPPVNDAARFLAWLIAHGRREPGQVLYGTSDDLAFLFSLHAEELAKHYRMYQPPLSTLLGVLDKKALYDAALEVGLEVPETYYPADAADVARLAPTLPYPLLIKQRIQVFSSTHSKGAEVARPRDLVRMYAEFARDNTFPEVLLTLLPDVAQPMLQRYLPEAHDGIFSVSGFIDRTGKHFVARGARKILQRPLRMGIGLCFESAEATPELARTVAALCRRVGFFGAFDCELIQVGDRFLLIDFNPRFFNQLAFDVARGMPLPWLVYLGALGQDEALARAVREAAAAGEHHRDAVFCNRLGLEVYLGTHRLTGRVGAGDLSRWRAWLGAERLRVDPVAAWDDPAPAVLEAFGIAYGAARHPRSFLRKHILDR